MDFPVYWAFVVEREGSTCEVLILACGLVTLYNSGLGLVQWCTARYNFYCKWYPAPELLCAWSKDV